MTEEKTSTEIWSIVSDRDKCTMEFMNQKWLPSDEAILIDDVKKIVCEEQCNTFHCFEEKRNSLMVSQITSHLRDKILQKLKSRGKE